MTTLNVGVLLNPIAGFGGRLALHGTDRLPSDRFDEAVSTGRSERRLRRALDVHRSIGPPVELIAAPGLLGEKQLAAVGIAHHTLSVPGLEVGSVTTRDDTRAAARVFAETSIDCLVFAGGDGTATDLALALGTGIPVIGVPSGVKMHSEIFTRSPESAGRLLSEFLRSGGPTELVEVLDVGPDDRTGVVAELRAPRIGEPLQGAKSVPSPRGGAVERRAIARELLREAGKGTTWIIGPGSTTGSLAECAGFEATLRGIDVLHPSGEVEHDVDEVRLYGIVCSAEQPRLALGVVGGQGFLLGRGNHEISIRVLEQIGADRVSIIATEEKIGGLFPPVLFIDVDDEHLPQSSSGGKHPLEGYRRVRTGPRQSTVMRVVNAAV